MMYYKLSKIKKNILKFPFQSTEGGEQAETEADAVVLGKYMSLIRCFFRLIILMITVNPIV